MNILMVCLGNICRSPLAEGIMKTKVPASFLIDSAGTISLHEGKHPDKRAIETAAMHGIDISKQRSRPITAADFEKFDKIYCMDIDVMADVVSKARTEKQRQKVSLFLEVLGDYENAEVPDPYWGGADEFEHVFQLLEAGCNKMAEQVLS
ncbi:low molecular weight phosphotyrosine protein phosphatase [Chryseobacterium sp. SN22]|uniref:low molecular weight protein-tyrosine-phosphatase n=1 Tax=Chryseobacterium sp. SN22 TaxID=2606431 RepID=UPI0011EEC724|nr:low molecular weight protein-tyrosine-phosphatase [Chryseobacterium sp. SN22]KAA0130667.1 low molecular weight phosphotyrosine protein phosphatase [Chryseobacterium sp. SN22]